MSRFVLDSSVVLAWFLDRPEPAFAKDVALAISRGARCIVPALWHLEIANGLALAERRRYLTPSELAQSLSECDRLLAAVIDVRADVIPLRRAFDLARQFGLTSYDSVFLDLALSEGLPLATLDKQLREAAVKAGITLFK